MVFSTGVEPDDDRGTSRLRTLALRAMAPLSHMRSGLAPRVLPRPRSRAGQEGSAAGIPDPDRLADLLRPHLDSDFYLSCYPDVAGSGMDPALHYCLYGWREGRDPGPGFCTRAHLAAHPALARQGINPFWHHLTDGGSREIPAPTPRVDTVPDPDPVTGRDPGPGAPQETPEEDPVLAVIRPALDAAFYQGQFPPADRPADPALHYLTRGWSDGHDPTPDFSTRYYLSVNPDVAAAGVNPFWHYLVAGRAEGRAPCHPGGARHKRITSQPGLEEVAQRALRKEPAPRPLGSGAILARLRTALVAAQARDLILSIGHDDYRRISGGVQFCIAREAALAPGREAVYLNLHPWQPLPWLARTGSDPLLVLVLGGEEIGTARLSAMTAAIGLLSRDSTFAHDGPSARGGVIRPVIHQMLGHSPEGLAALVRATGRRDCWLWLHDFFTLCPSFTLQRNGIDFCGAPDAGSNACRLCLYGEERLSHQARISAALGPLDLHVLAPSQGTLDLWQGATGLVAHRAQVLPHLQLVPQTRRSRRKGRPEDPAAQDRPLTLAYAGTPAPFKGWPLFCDLATRLAADPRFRFVHCGQEAQMPPGVANVPVHVTPADPEAMIRALREVQADLVLHWPSWPETFSFSTTEAMAAGAGVITHPGAGNVATLVRTTGRGVLLSCPDELAAFLEDGRAGALVARLRQAPGLRPDHGPLSFGSFSSPQVPA